MKAKEWEFDSLVAVLIVLWEPILCLFVTLPDINFGTASAVRANAGVLVVARGLPSLDVGLEEFALASMSEIALLYVVGVCIYLAANELQISCTLGITVTSTILRAGLVGWVTRHTPVLFHGDEVQSSV